MIETITLWSKTAQDKSETDDTYLSIINRYHYISLQESHS